MESHVNMELNTEDKLESNQNKRFNLNTFCMNLITSQFEPWSFILHNVEDGKGYLYEPLYQKYNQLQKQNAVLRFLYTALLFNLWVLFVPGMFYLEYAYIFLVIELTINVILFILYKFILKPVCKVKVIVAHVLWFVVWFELCANASRRFGLTYNESLGWAIVFNYLHWATMPFGFVKLCLFNVMSTFGFIMSQYMNHYVENEYGFWIQQAFNTSLLVISTMFGVASYLTMDKHQRITFLEARRNYEVKHFIEEQSNEQERLLLSVLPEHVAVQMRQDDGGIDRQFKKIYMSRHENVSILYADIVGFTAISSTYSAQDLVAILNELFARFDRLAEKYNQLRIKILGDCYYCISGAPVEREDHAILSVHMGLSMVKAIKYVQQITNSPVDMRVGIHTGAVLAGVLGQRQWQFDVYSKDVELANKMESSGMAGRVHISEVTYSFLGNHFEVEPAHGERREEALRQAGIKTYFIVKVLIPFQSSNHVKNGKPNVTFEDEKKQVSTNGNPDVGDNEEVQLDTPSDLKDDDEESVKSPLEENKIDEVEALIKGLENEILKKNEHEELKGNTTLCLRFNDKELEHQYTERTEICNIMYIVHPFVLPICMYIMLYFQSIRDTNKLIFVTMFVVFVSTIGYGVYIWIRVKPYNTLKRICTLINIFSMVVGMIVQVYWDECKESCEQWSYYWHCCVCIILSALFISPLTVAPHTVLLLALPAVLSLPYILYPRQGEHRAVYYINETDTNRPFVHQTLLIIDSLHYYRHALMLFFISIALAIYIRYIDACSRARFVRCVRVRRARAQADEMRRRNEKLVLNILPPHVAAHFMRGARRHHSDLYSQSLAEVGVLFASMPNFTEFYSEETVNNQGLECLRFLNEVISDFDALLEKPQFHDIIKIKTIGSTYMAASGINPRDVKPDDTITVRWQHLDCLVQFAIELKDALQGINEQSFNHFVLKMGINHGPITAGVIGARKPHYDIWGNTVNVASRMESTGKAGCIQVTTETSEILKHFGYYFEQRGLVAVKGKGQLMTYYLLGKHTQADKTEIKHNESEASKHVTGDTNVISGTSTAKVKFKQDSTDVDETSETAPLNDEKTISGSGGNGRRKELSLNGDVKSRLLSDDGCEGDHDN